MQPSNPTSLTLNLHSSPEISTESQSPISKTATPSRFSTYEESPSPAFFPQTPVPHSVWEKLHETWDWEGKTDDGFTFAKVEITDIRFGASGIYVDYHYETSLRPLTLPAGVFLSLFQPCKTPTENSSSKTPSLWGRLCSFVRGLF
jgi:hypothetical protein